MLPPDIVANLLDCDVIVSKYELPLCYYVHFRTNTFEKGMNPLTPSYSLNSTTLIQQG